MQACREPVPVALVLLAAVQAARRTEHNRVLTSDTNSKSSFPHSLKGVLHLKAEQDLVSVSGSLDVFLYNMQEHSASTHR